MPIFQVQIRPDARWDKQPYKRVEAATAKEAAEKLFGHSLQENGAMGQIRARVHSLGGPRGNGSIFYEL